MAADVSIGIETALKRHLSLLPAKPSLSDSTKAHIKRYIPPKALPRYETPEQAIALLAMEISGIGARISKYQFIERYRDHFEPAGAEMRVAFVSHIHHLRGAEVYLIMERCIKCLGFFFDLATNLDLGPNSTARWLTKRFKEKFDRHLRERHQLTHAHERPSLVSRLTSIPATELNEPEVAKTFTHAIATFMSLISPQLRDRQYKSSEEALAAINTFRLESVDEECLEMWSIFVEALHDLIDVNQLRKE